MDEELRKSLGFCTFKHPFLSPMRRVLLHLALLLLASSLHGQLRFEVDLQSESRSSEVANPVAFDQRIFFCADDVQHGHELWVHEPQTDRTYLLADLNEGLESSSPRNFVKTADYLYFFAAIDSNSDGLFQLARGSNKVERVPARGASSNFTDLTLFKGKLMIGTEFALSERNLAANREQRLHPTTGSNSANIRFLGQDDDQLYFSSFNVNTQTIEIYSYDGSSVTQLTNFNSLSFNTQIREGVLVQDHLALSVAETDRLCLLNLSDNSFSIDSTIELSFHRFQNVKSVFTVYENELYIKVDEGLHDIKRYDFNAGGLDPSFAVRPWASARWSIEEHNGHLYGWFSSRGSEVDSAFLINPNGNHTPFPDFIDVIETYTSVGVSQNQLAYLNNKLYGYGDPTGRDFEPVSFDLTTKEFQKLKNINTSTIPAGVYQLLPYDDEWLVISGRLDSAANPSTFSYGSAGVKLYNPTTREVRDVTTLHPDIDWARGYAFRIGDDLLLQNASVRNEDCNLASLNLQTNELLCLDTIGAMGNSGNGFSAPIPFNNKIYYGDQNNFIEYAGTLESVTPGQPGSNQVADPDSIIVIPSGASNLHWFTSQDALYFIEGTDIFTRPGPDFKLMRMDTNEALSIIDIDTFTIRGTGGIINYSDRIFWQYNSLGHGAYFKPGQQVSSLKYNGEIMSRISRGHVPIETDSTLIFNSNDRIFSMDKRTDSVSLIVDLDSVTSNLFGNTFLMGQLGNVLLFTSRESVGTSFTYPYGREVYAYDLGTGELQLAGDIYPGPTDSRPRLGLTYKDRFYFFANDPLRDQELWSYAPNCFSIDLTITPDSSNTSPNGSATVTSNGGQSPFEYLWSNGQTSTSIADLPAGFVEVTVTDSEGCTTSANAWIETVFPEISVSDTKEQRTIPVSIFPNPTHDVLIITTEETVIGDYVVQLFDVSGRLVLSQKLAALDRLELDLSLLRSGIYFLQLENRETRERVVKKVIKE